MRRYLVTITAAIITGCTTVPVVDDQGNPVLDEHGEPVTEEVFDGDKLEDGVEAVAPFLPGGIGEIAIALAGLVNLVSRKDSE